jgi:N-dimethylarginine dimethylaminohydrolase
MSHTMRKTIEPSCFNETDRLESVILGYPDNLYLNQDPNAPYDPNNQLLAKSIAAGKRPVREKSMAEFSHLTDVLRGQGINVLTPKALAAETGVINQMYARDIGFVVGKTLYISGMSRPNRREEWRGIEEHLDEMPKDRVERVPQGVVAEGGDIVVDKGNVFVGISQRTTREGFDYLAEQVTKQGLKAVPVELRSLTQGQDVLHLDCAFVPVGKNSALLFEDGMTEVPPEIRDTYDIISVTPDEQQELGTNVLVTSPTQVIARDMATRVNGEMRKRGIEVIEVPFNEAPRAGGSLRCCTLPLVRVAMNSTFRGL